MIVLSPPRQRDRDNKRTYTNTRARAYKFSPDKHLVYHETWSGLTSEFPSSVNRTEKKGGGGSSAARVGQNKLLFTSARSTSPFGWRAAATAIDRALFTLLPPIIHCHPALPRVCVRALTLFSFLRGNHRLSDQSTLYN